MSLYGRIFAAMYDRMTAAAERAGLRRHRADLLSLASGRVLEVGAGTGANLDLYPPAVTELVLTEPEEPMAVRLDRHCARSGRPATIVRAPAERLPFADDSFDSVVCTLVLCTVDDLGASLAEIRRVLRPSGQLLFCEHVRSQDPRLARWQDRLNRIQNFVGHGCNCNRATIDSIAAAGFEVGKVTRESFDKMPPHVQPLATGSATSP